MGSPLYPGSNGHRSARASSSATASSFTPGLRGGSFASSSSKSYNKPVSDYDASYHPGLLNLGNTCFLNSVIQAIGNTRDFRLLIQGPPDSASDDLEPPTPTPLNHTTAALSRHNQWPNRSQSPALRVSDNEHGRRIDHPHPPIPSGSHIDSALAQDPAATIKPPKHHASGTSASSTLTAYQPDVIDLPLNTAFRHVLEKFWIDGHRSRSSTNINPKHLLNLLGKKYDQYLEYGQQDGHELMRHLLDACRMEEIDVIKKMRPPPPAAKKARIANVASPLTPADVENAQIVAHPAAAGDADQRAEELLPFLDLLFCGKLASMVVCEGCKKVSHTYEDFYDLSLSLRQDAAGPKSRRRDRLRSMADRWKRATQSRTIVDRKAAAAATAASNTPIGTPKFSENEASDADSSTKPSRKAAGLLSPDEGGVRGRFALRTRSLRREGRHEKLGATSGSEMEPDFPDMASLSLAPTGSSGRGNVDSAPASASEDNGDARTGTRVARMLGSARNEASSRETSPIPPLDRSATQPFATSMHPPLRSAKSSSHQTAYIARIMAEDTSGPADPAAARKAGAPSPLFDAVAAVASVPGRPLHGLFRSLSTGARTRDPCADFEPNPKSQGAKRRHKIREEQATTGLIASLRQFTSVEVLDGENSFACKNCWRLANPPSAQGREQIRRRRSRRVVAPAEVDDEDGSEPSSSDGGSDGEKQQQRGADADDTVVANGAAMTSSASQSTLTSSVDSISTGSSASQPSRPHVDIPTISMTSADADTPTDAAAALRLGRSSSGSTSVNGPSVIARDYANGSSGGVMQHKLGSESSLSSVEAPARSRDRLGPNYGYDTGTETDASGFSTGLDDSNASGTDTEAEASGPTKPATSERKGPKRSAQSLPRRALKRYLIASAPPVLIFHLKRFQATGRGFVTGLAGFKKIDDQVTFPEYLDITPWLAPPREEYDRRGRLKASSDPLAIRKRAEEEAVKAGVDARNVRVEVGGRRARGKRQGMWSWHLSDIKQHLHHPNPHHHGAGGGDLEAGPKVQSSSGQEIIPSVIRRPKTEYRLYAVIVHQGSLSAGHYTAYVLSDRIKVKDGPKEMVARSAPTSRVNTPAPASGAPSEAKDQGVANGLGNFFLGGSRPGRTMTPAMVPMRAASAAPVSMTSTASMSSLTTTSGSSSHDIAPQTSISSLETDGSQRSTSGSEPSGGGGGGPMLVRPKPKLKTMESWDSLDELEQSHAAGTATPTTTTAATGLEPSKAVPTVASHHSNAHRHVDAGAAVGGEESDDVDPRGKDDGRRWVYTSDTIVRAATIDEVLKAKAYMLFYERI